VIPVPRKVWLQTLVVMRLTSELRVPTTIRAIFDGLEKGDPSGVRESRAHNRTDRSYSVAPWSGSQPQHFAAKVQIFR
jgi:hypothetical protein